MNNRFEANNIDEVKEAVEHFNDFHDDYVAEIEIKFENYKALDNEGASTGITSADKTVVLTVNTYPYRKEHEQYVQVEFKDVISFEIVSTAEDTGPTWGTLDTYVWDAPDGDNIRWEFQFICGDSIFIVICSKIVFIEKSLDP